jgi:SAM-dependent methyltransferase
VRGMASPYDESFYSAISASSAESAEAIVPAVHEIVGATSVLDVGCGSCEWLRAWAEIGVTDLAGVEGSIAAPSIPTANVTMVDLATETFDLGRRFDLVTSLEVAEHLPESASSHFVDLLVAHGDVVVFSAAVPGQGGWNHINEQWPCFWIDIFATRGFEILDVLRPRIWDDSRAAFYYRQNMLLFVKRSRSPEILARCRDLPSFGGRSIVHPDLCLIYRRESDRGVKELVKELKPATTRALRRRVDRLVSRAG